METTIEKLKALVAGLDQLITFLEKHPTLAADENLYVNRYRLNLFVYGKERARFSRLARSLASGGPKLNKEYSDYSCAVERMFGEYVKFSVSTARETVCQRVVTGTKIVPAQSYPERVEEIVEWKCK